MAKKNAPMGISDKFHWARRVPRKEIQRLYESDAQGRPDEELLEKVCYGIYARISDMLEVMEAQQHGRVRCRNCGALLANPFRMGSRSKGEVMKCAQCGWQTTCGEFYDSYTGERLLPGSVPGVFEGFMRRWPEARTPQAKMLLVDWLIHEFHVLQGIAGRPVGENVIQGTAKQVAELIAGLAGGPGSTEGLLDRGEWLATLNDPVRLFRRAHSRAEVLKIAAELGIRGRSKMSEKELVKEILRLAPERSHDIIGPIPSQR
jgi:RNase P subunit RPR2